MTTHDAGKRKTAPSRRMMLSLFMAMVLNASYLGGGGGCGSRNDGFIGDRDGQVRVVDKRPSSGHFARLKLPVERHEMGIAVETAVRHFRATLVGAGRAATAAARALRAAGQLLLGSVDAGSRFQAASCGRGGRHLLVGLVPSVLIAVVVGLVRPPSADGPGRRCSARSSGSDVRTVEISVPVLHQRDGRMVGQVSAAGSGRRAEAIRILAQYDAEGRRGTTPDPAGYGRLLELPRAVLNFTPAAGLHSTAHCGYFRKKGYREEKKWDINFLRIMTMKGGE